MVLNFILLALVVLLGVSAVLCSAGNSTLVQSDVWVQSETALPGNWFSVASSSSGSLLVAASSVKGPNASGIYLSSDRAVTWKNVFIQGSGLNEQWNSVAISSDGYIVYAVQQDLGLFSSNNQGYSWTRTIVDPSLSYANYNSVSCSSTGAVVATTFMGGYIYVSNDFGRSFAPAKSLSTNSWYFVSVSTNGNSLTAGADYLYTSMNGGAVWSRNTAPNRAWTAVAYSSGSFYAVAVAERQMSSGGVYLSSDSGVTWNLLPAADQSLYWMSVAIDSTGAVITAVASTDGVYYSTDFGKTFTKANLPASNSYRSLAATSDGTYNVVTSMYNGGIFYTTD